MKRLLVLLPIALAVSACASTAETSARNSSQLALYRAHAVEQVGSIPFSGSINRWTSLGDSALAVWTSPSRAWLLELTSRCPDLEHSYGIGFDSRDGRIDAGSVIADAHFHVAVLPHVLPVNEVLVDRDVEVHHARARRRYSCWISMNRAANASR